MEWFEDGGALFGWLLALSVVMFVGSLLLLPVVIVRLPADFFTREELTATSWRRRHNAVRLLLRIAKNLLGLLLVIAGLVMIFTPGQGLIALLVGLSLLDVPGKRRAQLAIVGRPGVLRAINALRRRTSQPPLEMPAETGAAEVRSESAASLGGDSDNPLESPRQDR